MMLLGRLKCVETCTRCNDHVCALPIHEGDHVCGACAEAWAKGLTT
jgi:hypothetical protein